MQIREKISDLDKLKEIMNEYKSKLEDAYNRANSVSQKNRITFDLENFSEIYRNIFVEDEMLSWEQDEELDVIGMKKDIKQLLCFVDNLNDNNAFYSELSKKVINDYINIQYPFYTNYNRTGSLSKLSNKEIIEIVSSFLSSYDEENYLEFKKKVKDLELLYFYDLERYDGVSINISSLNKTFILLDSIEGRNINLAKTLAHEYGHSFEFGLHNKSGINLYLNSFDNPYYEISSCFFEYAFFNYLIENRIYTKDAKICLDTYLKELFAFSFDMHMLSETKELEVHDGGWTRFTDEEVMAYGDKIKEKANFYQLNSLNDKVSVIESYIYSIGMISSVYLYENYKQDKELFKKNFKNALYSYPITKDISSFESIGLTKENLLESDTLRKILKKNYPR